MGEGPPETPEGKEAQQQHIAEAERREGERLWGQAEEGLAGHKIEGVSRLFPHPKAEGVTTLIPSTSALVYIYFNLYSIYISIYFNIFFPVWPSIFLGEGVPKR